MDGSPSTLAVENQESFQEHEYDSERAEIQGHLGWIGVWAAGVPGSAGWQSHW